MIIKSLVYFMIFPWPKRERITSNDTFFTQYN